MKVMWAYRELAEGDSGVDNVGHNHNNSLPRRVRWSIMIYQSTLRPIRLPSRQA